MQNATAHNFIDQNVDRESLENQVKDMYQRVAENPDGEFHFEMGRAYANAWVTSLPTWTKFRPTPLNHLPVSVTIFTWRN